VGSEELLEDYGVSERRDGEAEHELGAQLTFSRQSTSPAEGAKPKQRQECAKLRSDAAWRAKESMVEAEVRCPIA
jgi:hypothetical protein